MSSVESHAGLKECEQTFFCLADMHMNACIDISTDMCMDMCAGLSLRMCVSMNVSVHMYM